MKILVKLRCLSNTQRIDPLVTIALIIEQCYEYNYTTHIQIQLFVILFFIHMKIQVYIPVCIYNTHSISFGKLISTSNTLVELGSNQPENSINTIDDNEMIHEMIR